MSASGSYDAAFGGAGRSTAERLRDLLSTRRAAAAQEGQAAVELVALLPLLVAVALGILQALAAGVATELAGHAAQSGAVAIAEGRDGAAAARASLPGWAQSRVRIELRGTRVRVRVTPPSLLPTMGQRLTASVTADAGP